MQYARELREYQKSEAYQITCAKVQDKKIKRGAYALLYLVLMLNLRLVHYFVFKISK